MTTKPVAKNKLPTQWSFFSNAINRSDNIWSNSSARSSGPRAHGGSFSSPRSSIPLSNAQTPPRETSTTNLSPFLSLGKRYRWNDCNGEQPATATASSFHPYKHERGNNEHCHPKCMSSITLEPLEASSNQGKTHHYSAFPDKNLEPYDNHASHFRAPLMNRSQYITTGEKEKQSEHNTIFIDQLPREMSARATQAYNPYYKTVRDSRGEHNKENSLYTAQLTSSTFEQQGSPYSSSPAYPSDFSTSSNEWSSSSTSSSASSASSTPLSSISTWSTSTSEDPFATPQLFSPSGFTPPSSSRFSDTSLSTSGEIPMESQSSSMGLSADEWEMIYALRARRKSRRQQKSPEQSDITFEHLGRGASSSSSMPSRNYSSSSSLISFSANSSSPMPMSVSPTTQIVAPVTPVTPVTPITPPVATSNDPASSYASLKKQDVGWKRNTNSSQLDHSLHAASTRAPSGDHPSRNTLYRTELCSNFMRFGNCQYDLKCHYAHGQAELRSRARTSTYKTRPCIDTVGHEPCPYGNRCNYTHPGESLRCSAQTFMKHHGSQYKDEEYFTWLKKCYPGVASPFGIFV